MTTIKLKNGSGAPTSGDLAQGEPALDLTNKRLYTEDSGGTVIEVGTNPGTDVTFADNRKAIFGAGSDLQIYHDGTHSNIKESGAGDLQIFGDNVNIYNAAGSQNLINLTSGGANTLFHSGSAKLATTATGIDVTGTAVVDQLNINSASYDNRQLGMDSNGFFIYNAADARYDMVISDTGNVGIGNSSPDSVLTAVNAASTAALRIGLNNTSFNYMDADNNIFRSGAGTERMRIDSSGNVGIGTSSPVTLKSSTTLQVSGNAKLGDDNGRGLLSLGDISSTGANAGIWRGAAGAYAGTGNFLNLGGYDGITFTTGNADISSQTERMRIDSSGNLLVGTTTTNIATEGTVIYGAGNEGVMQLSSTAMTALYVNRSNDGELVQFRVANSAVGSISVASSTTSYNTSSDQRLKDNIVDAPSASDDIDAIQVRSFDWKADGSHQKYGMVAQELQSVAPEAVTGDADSDDMMGVDYSKLVPMMLKEIQSLRARVAQLEGDN